MPAYLSAEAQIAYEALATAAVDPSVSDFGVADLEEIQQRVHDAHGWLYAAECFFHYRVRRMSGENTEACRVEFVEKLSLLGEDTAHDPGSRT